MEVEIRTHTGGKVTMPNDSNGKAAEFHDLAAHAHRVAATHHAKGDHQTGQEHSRQALEHSVKAHQFAEEALAKSNSSLSNKKQ